MSEQLKIAWVTAELAPYVKIGGLADVSHALPKALSHHGHDVRIILPLHKSILDDYELKRVNVSFLDFRGDRCNLYLQEDDNLTIYFLDHPLFEQAAYDGDLGKKFSTFCWLVSRIFDQLNWYPTIVHANDWHTALLPPLLQEIPVKTVFTIHNIAYQGIESADYLAEIGLESMIDDDQMNFMKLGIRYADLVTTVSKTYASEILISEYGYGLEEELQKHPKEIRGIVHGIDIEEYDPASDEKISTNYNSETLNKKSANKLALQNQANLPQNENTFTIGMVSRLVEQKGVNLLIEILPALVEMDLQVIVLGTGQDHFERELQRMAYAYQEKIGVFLTYSPDLSHKIFAGVDAFLVPSKFEPCGLTQLYSLAYGTIPIVRHTGGLADTVTEGSEQHNGFVFHNFDPNDLYEAIERAYKTYNEEKGKWRQIQLNGMSKDLSWDKPANEWIELYNELLDS